MLPVVEVMNLLKGSDYSKYFNSIMVNQIPKADVSATNKTNLVVSEVRDAPSEFGNNTFTLSQQIIQIQIFYSLNFDTPINKLENSLMRFMIANNWTIYDKQTHYTDTTTGKIVSVMQFTRTSEIEVL